MEDMGHPWPHNYSWHWISSLCAKFQHSSMIRSVSRTSPSSSVTKDIWGSWPETWRTWVVLDLIVILDIEFLMCVPNFSILAWLEVCQEPPVLGGCWWFLTGDLEDRIILDIMDALSRSRKFQVNIFTFGWVIRVCHVCPILDVQTNGQTNRQTETT